MMQTVVAVKGSKSPMPKHNVYLAGFHKKSRDMKITKSSIRILLYFRCLSLSSRLSLKSTANNAGNGMKEWNAIKFYRFSLRLLFQFLAYCIYYYKVVANV